MPLYICLLILLLFQLEIARRRLLLLMSQYRFTYDTPWHMCSYQRNFKCHRDTKTETVPYVSHNIKNYHPRWIDTFDKLPENSWIAHVKYLLFIEHWRTFAINLFVICASVTLYQCMNRSTEFQRWRVVWTGEIEIVCSIWIVYCLCSMSMSCFCVCMGIVYKQSANIA